MRTLIIIFLIRRRLKLKLGEPFMFTTQKETDSYYYFTPSEIKKVYYVDGVEYCKTAGVGLNWLLDDRCKIIKKEV